MQPVPPEEAVEYYERGLKYATCIHVKCNSILADVDLPDKIILPWHLILRGASSTRREMPVSIETHNPTGSPISNEEATRQSFMLIRRAWPSAAPSSMQEALKPAASFLREYKGDPVRFVVVGMGMGRNRSIELQETSGCKLYGVVDINEEKARRAGEEFGVPYSTDINDFLRDPKVEVMYTVVPTGLHASVSEQCLLAGKHVLTTKPMDVSAANCQRLIDCAKKGGRLLGVDYDMRQNEVQLSLKKALDNGYFGHMLLVSSSLKAWRSQEYYDENGAWRGTWELDGGGAMCNQGVHEIDRIYHLFGLPKRVRAVIGTQMHAIETEDLGYAEWDYGNQMAVRFLATTNHPVSSWHARFEMHGSAGAFIHVAGGPDGSSDRYGKDGMWTKEAPYPVERKFRQASDAFAYALRSGTAVYFSWRGRDQSASYLGCDV
ncbi:MAG: Gfo/Idh/MocA family oxidoreductase [Clostridiales bacterium]|nr:Gfo/Idh/MocA family oxidoreductase [Clostridiales bacterium]